MITSYYIQGVNITITVLMACIFGILWQFLNFWLINLAMNYIGLLFVEVGLLRAGNESLLNNLTEGLVIVDQ